MTREQFDKEFDNETVLGLTQDRVKYKTLKQLATGFQRPDVASILDDLVRALDVAIATAEHLTAPAKEFS